MNLETIKLTVLGTIFIAIAITFHQINYNHICPIESVRVYGMDHLNSQEVQQALTPLVTRGFFTVNVNTIRERLLEFPWVSNTIVKREWPNRIDILLIEKKAVALWSQTGEDERLLSETGEIFSPNHSTYPLHLPTLKGPPGMQVTMLNYLSEVNRLLVPLHAKLSYLELTPFLTWKLILDNGITLQLGHKDVLTRLDHFVKVYPKIVGPHAADVETVDLRYPNGVAVAWKTTKTGSG